MKTSRSAFADFPRDEFTTLPETHDRLLATSLTTTWTYGDTDVEFGAIFRAVRSALLDAFARARQPVGATHALRDGTKSCSTRSTCVDSISLEMPNRHHLPIDLTTLRHGESQRDVRRDRRAARPDQGDALTLMHSMASCLIRSQRVVLPDGVRPATIRVEDGRITRQIDSSGTSGTSAPPGTLIDAGNAVGDAGPRRYARSHQRSRPRRLGRIRNGDARRGRRRHHHARRHAAQQHSGRPPRSPRSKPSGARPTGRCHVDVGFWGGVVPGNARRPRAARARRRARLQVLS